MQQVGGGPGEGSGNERSTYHSAALAPQSRVWVREFSCSIPYAGAVQPQRIYVRAPNWVGDLVMATASFARLRAGFPQARISCALRPYLRSLLAGAEFFDELIDDPKAGLPGLLRLTSAVRRRRFDLAIVYPNSLRTGLVPFLARVPRRMGYQLGRRWLMNEGRDAEIQRGQWGKKGRRRVPKPMPEYYEELLDGLGIPPGQMHPVLAVTEEEREACERWLRERGVGAGDRLVVCNAGASYGASKLWEPDKFAAVAKHFRAQGAVVVFLAGPAEVDMVRQIAEESGALATIDPVQPVGMLKPMLDRAALVITTDSGPRHVAVAMDAPVVCLMGPNDRRYTDYCLEKQVVIRKDLECAPCQRRVCPLEHRNCMKFIEVDEVVQAGEELLTTWS